MSDSKKSPNQPPFTPIQNQCREPDGPPLTSADPTKAENKYTAQLATKTATGEKGHDQMNPVTPGHAELVIGVEDNQQQMSRVETYGLEPRGGTLDNFKNKGGGDDPAHYPFGDGNDVRVNYHTGKPDDDFPSPDKFPFVSEPRPISKEQYEYSRYLSSQAGDYQVAGNNCVDYAVDNYNQTVGQDEFEAKKEYGVISSPRKLGEDIQKQKGAAGQGGGAGADPVAASGPSFGAGVAMGLGSSAAGAAMAGLVGGKMGPVAGKLAEGVANQVIGQLAAGGLDLGKLFSEGGALSGDSLMGLASGGLSALAGGGALGDLAGQAPGLMNNIVAGEPGAGGMDLEGMVGGAAAKMMDQALGKLLAVNDKTPAGEAILKTLASKYKDQLKELAMDPQGTMAKLKAMLVPGPSPTSVASVPLGLATPSGAGVVLVNGQASARIGDMCTPIPSVPPDAGPFIQGNPTVIINGKPASGFGHLAIGLTKGTAGTALKPAATVLMGTATVTDVGIYNAAKAAAGGGSSASRPSPASAPAVPAGSGPGARGGNKTSETTQSTKPTAEGDNSQDPQSSKRPEPSQGENPNPPDLDATSSPAGSPGTTPSPAPGPGSSPSPAPAPTPTPAATPTESQTASPGASEPDASKPTPGPGSSPSPVPVPTPTPASDGTVDKPEKVVVLSGDPWNERVMAGRLASYEGGERYNVKDNPDLADVNKVVINCHGTGVDKTSGEPFIFCPGYGRMTPKQLDDYLTKNGYSGKEIELVVCNAGTPKTDAGGASFASRLASQRGHSVTAYPHDTKIDLVTGKPMACEPYEDVIGNLKCESAPDKTDKRTYEPSGPPEGKSP